nr:PREDICTED: uncharacterized protein LOC107078100 [Lepisosteus oculatus]
MGGSVSVTNNTPYPWSYCYSYMGSTSSIKGSGTLYGFQSRTHEQREILSYLYVKYGSCSASECLSSCDMVRFYNGIDRPTFTIQECHSRTRAELVCDRGGDRPSCENRVTDFLLLSQLREVEEKFNNLLFKYEIKEDQSLLSSTIEDRMKNLQNHLTAQFCEEHDLTVWSQFTFDSAINYEQLSLTEKFGVLEGIVQLALEDAPDTLTKLQSQANCDEKYGFLLHLLTKIYTTNATLAGHLLLSVLDVFAELSNACKELLCQILFNKLWTPVEIVFFIRGALHLPQEQMESVLHTVQTYGFDMLTAFLALKNEEPVEVLQQSAKLEEDKDLETVLNEMRANHYPEETLSIIEDVLRKVRDELPKFKFVDLDDEMIKDGISMIQSLDWINPDQEVLTKVLIGLCIGVQDCSTIMKPDKKIEGYFPRTTQLAALLMFLLSGRSPDTPGCLLEIGTGEGKSCILAMFATIQAIRGTKVDIVTSSPVLARRDQQEWSKLFKMFGLCSSVVPPPNLNSCKDAKKRDESVREAYDKNIVYGTVGNFAADVLKQEFEKTRTRGDRGYDLVIVDEVDYMTLDNGVQVTFLSHEASGLRHLEQVLAGLWSMICTFQPVEVEETGEILWARIQLFHEAAFAAVMGSEGKENFSPIDILKPALQLGFFTEEDVERIQAVKTEAGQENAPVELEDQSWKILQVIMSKIGVAEQRDLLTVFEEVLESTLAFQCYSLTHGKAVRYGEHNPNREANVRMLLLENGRACELVPQQQIINTTVPNLNSRIKYTDNIKNPDQIPKDTIVLPLFLRDYVKKRLAVFVENGLRAITMTQDREYMIHYASADAESVTESGKSEKHQYQAIIPVDFKASGVLEKNKRWGDGLQQFLEMKHQLAVTPLSNVTNYLSNFHYFQKYLTGKGIFGVTGTLGGEADVEFLEHHYKARSYVIPAHRRKKVVELPAVQVSGGQDQWIQTICERVRTVTGRGQVALVICEDVRTAEELQQKMTAPGACVQSQVIMYTISGKHKVEKNKFKGGKVIIATNLGGRGTDIKVNKEVNRRGGLCVFLTHFPGSRRVEKQVFGRTARKGNPGMVQMVLNREALAPAYRGQPIEAMRRLREDYEVRRIADMENDELLEIRMRAELFTCFCEKLRDFEGNYPEEQRKSPLEVKDLKYFEGPVEKFDYLPALNALKESWALWLLLHEQKINQHLDVGVLRSDLCSMLQHTAEHLLRGSSTNFYDHIKQAVSRMDLHSRKKSHDYGALSCWQRAIEAEGAYRAVSLYNQAYITINMQKDGYKGKAIDLLNEAKKAVDIYVLETTNTVASCNISCAAKFKPHRTGGTNFQGQMEARLSLMKNWKEYITKATEKLKSLQESKDDAIAEEASVYSLSGMKSYIVMTELMALYEYGLCIVFEVKKKPRFCIDALICALLGVCQIFLGALVCVLSFGTASQVGLGIISEGVSDLIQGVQGMIEGKFDWKEWAISKSISLGISLVTAGFSTIKNIVSSVYKTTRALVTGAKSFSSVFDDIFRAGKSTFSALKGNAKTAFSALSTEMLENSWKNVSSHSVTTSVKHVAKYTVQEIAKQGVITALDYAIDQGLNEIFQKILSDAFKDSVTSNVKSNEHLRQYLTKFIVTNGVPSGTSLSDPNAAKIPDQLQKTMKHLLSDCLLSTFDDPKYTSELKGVLKQVSEVQDKITDLMKKAGVSGALQKTFKMSMKIQQFSSDFIQMLKSIPTESMINKFVGRFINNMEDSLEPEKQCRDHKMEEMAGLRDVGQLQEEFLGFISEQMSDEFLQTCIGHLTSMVTSTFQKKLNRTVGTATSNLLGRHQTQRFFDEQEHPRDTRRPGLSEADRRELAAYAERISDVRRPATALDVRVLTSGDIIGGRGVRIVVVDEEGKQRSVEHFRGRDGTAGDITLRLTRAPPQEESGRGPLAALGDGIRGGEAPYRGHFDLVGPDGAVVPVKSEDRNGFYHAIAQATTGQQGDEARTAAETLRTAVRDEVECALCVCPHLSLLGLDFG